MNKILLTILFTFTLSACTLFPQKFDNHEHALLSHFVIDMETLHTACSGSGEDVKFTLRRMHRDIRVLEVYTRTTPKNEEVHNVAKILMNDIAEFRNYYKKKGHNKFYCETKTDLVHKKALRMLQASGKKPR